VKREGRMPLVLVIDDSPDVRAMLVTILYNLGLSAIAAVSGEEGITMFKSLRPDLVIADIDLSGADGMPLLKTVRREVRWAKVPWVLMVPANRNELALTEGCEYFLSKPFTAPIVGEVVSRALRDRDTAPTI
jgi:CheY-like chemotaxis protein